MIFLGWIVIACTVCTVSRLVLVERAVWGATLDKHHVCLVFCIACICELPWDITMLMWTTIVNSLSKVADHPMSSPCWVDRVGPVLAYRTMHLNNVVPASSPMIHLDVKWLYSTHLVWVDDPASRVFLAIAAKQWGKQAVQWIRWLPCLHLRHYRAVPK